MNASIVLSFLLALATAVQASVHSSPVIKTTSGILLGQTITLDNAQLVHRFLGVPYAQAPVGANRFERPKQIQNQTHTLVVAQQPKPTCIQMHHLSKAISPMLDVDQDHNISEDCLFLNIYVPAAAEQSNLPIMVWLPGEGFDFADARQFNGAYLASLGQVIVVTVQYRVGVFGFLKQNAGLWDQVAALQWINQNAQSLGGDPENVTLFGRFTGSMSISILLSSPEVINSPVPLFNRAILMSGVAVGQWVFDDASQHSDKIKMVFENTGCQNSDCLKSMPADQILAKSGYGWKPYFDSELIVEEPLVALRNGKFPKYVSNVMLGTNQFEGNLCLLKHMVVDQPFYDKLINNNMSTSEYAKAIREDLEMFYGSRVPKSSQGLVKGLVDRTNYVDFCSNLLIFENMRQYNELLKKIARNQSYGLESVFSYKLDYKPSFSIAPSFINSSIHGDDVILAFGLAFKSVSQATAHDQEISSLMVALFSNFAQTGIPFESNEYIEIKLSSDSRAYLAVSNSQILLVAFCCIIVFVLVFLVKLLAQILQTRPSQYVKHLIQNPSEQY